MRDTGTLTARSNACPAFNHILILISKWLEHSKQNVSVDIKQPDIVIQQYYSIDMVANLTQR